MRPLLMLVGSLILGYGAFVGVVGGGVWDKIVGVAGVALFGFVAVVSTLTLLHPRRPRTIPAPAQMPYAVRYRFADTQEVLVEACSRKQAPRRLRHLLPQDRGYPAVRTDLSRIGEPDAVIAVRVNGRALSTPGLPRFEWHRD